MKTQWFLAYSQRYVPITTVNFRSFQSPQKEIPYLLAVRFYCNSVIQPFLLLNKNLRYWLNHILFIYSWDYGHLYCFDFFAVMNSASRNIHAQFFGEIMLSFLLSIIPRSRMQDHVVTLLKILKTCQTVFHNSFTIFHSHQQYIKIQFFNILINTLLLYTS